MSGGIDGYQMVAEYVLQTVSDREEAIKQVTDIIAGAKLDHEDARKIATKYVDIVRPSMYGTGAQYMHWMIDFLAERAVKENTSEEELASHVRMLVPESRRDDAEKIAHAALEKARSI